MSRTPRVLALTAVLALPVAALVTSLLLGGAEPPREPAIVRIGESVAVPSPSTSHSPSVPSVPSESSPSPASPSPTSGQEEPHRSQLPPPPPVDDDDDDDDDDDGDDDDDDDDGADG